MTIRVIGDRTDPASVGHPGGLPVLVAVAHLRPDEREDWQRALIPNLRYSSHAARD